LFTLSKNCWPKVLGAVVIQLYAVECTPSVDRALKFGIWGVGGGAKLPAAEGQRVSGGGALSAWQYLRFFS